MNEYFIVSISAEDQEQVDSILNHLLDLKLVTGGQIINAPARFLWKGEVTDMDYYTITSYTLRKYKDEIISEVRKLSIEEVPMVTFVAFEGNEELLNWINSTLK